MSDEVPRVVEAARVLVDGWTIDETTSAIAMNLIKAVYALDADRPVGGDDTPHLDAAWVRDAAQGADPLSVRCRNCASLPSESCHVLIKPRASTDCVVTHFRRGRPPHDTRQHDACWAAIAAAIAAARLNGQDVVDEIAPLERDLDQAVTEIERLRAELGLVHVIGLALGLRPAPRVRLDAEAVLRYAQDVTRPDDGHMQVPRDLLESLAGPQVGDGCWFDHHGGCQAHGYLSLEPGEVCPQAQAKALLAAGPSPDPAPEILTRPSGQQEPADRCRWCDVDIARRTPDGAWFHERGNTAGIGAHTPEPNLDGYRPPRLAGRGGASDA